MEPYSAETTKPEYLEFYGVEDDERENYESGTENCVRLPNGIVCTQYDSRFSRRFVVADGKAYQRNFGPLKHNKRTKKAKRITVLPDYPRNKQYKSFSDYLETLGYEYDKEEGEHGYWSNPNSRWDWYQIGGRWPYRFLVKESAPSIKGELSWAADKQQPKAPEGYHWVAGAKKRYIEWDVMKSLYIEGETAMFALMEEWFKSKIAPEGYPSKALKESSIEDPYGVFYIEGETLNDYLARKGVPLEGKLIPYTYAFVQNEEWHSQDEMGCWCAEKDISEALAWRQKVQEYIDSVPDDDFLVSVDCHT
jgi:hypothetical protein